MNESKESSQGVTLKGENLSPGTVLAGRFKVEKYMGAEIVGESYLARDEKEDRQVAVTIIPSRYIKGSNILEKVKSEIKTASRIVHKNLLTCYGMGNLPDGSLYVPMQYIEGQKLYSILQKRMQSGKLFSLMGAYNLIAHLCNGMDEIHKTRLHGSLSPFSIRISSAGRVKIADLPLSRLYYLLPTMRKQIPMYVQGFWAPEIITKAGLFVTPRADIYSMGTVLFELLTSELPNEDNVSVTAHREDIPASIDEIVARCFDPDPSARWNNVLALKRALFNVAKEHEEEEVRREAEEKDDDLLMDFEIDIDQPIRRPSTVPPPVRGPLKPAARPLPSPAPASAAAPPAPAPSAHREPQDKALFSADAVTGERASPAAGGPERKTKGSKINLDEILHSMEDQDAEKWMVTKDGMDHGPFRTREVVQMIMRWEVEGQHVIQDLDKGVRIKLRESEEFKEIIERAKVEKQRKEETEALEKSEKAEKRGGVAKIFIVLAVVGGLGVIIGGYFITRAAVSHFSGGGEQIDLAENISIDIGKGGIVKDSKRKGKGKRKGGGGGGGAGGMSYDDYMAQGVEMGNVDSDGGQVQLGQGQINATMSSQGKKLYSCIYAELRKDKSLKKVSLKFAIEGKTGSVMGVSVTSGGSSELQSCVSSKMKGIKFPTFSAPRMGATFYFNVGN
ncbi:MAG: protein kinase [Pseudomonadota bacterium]